MALVGICQAIDTFECLWWAGLEGHQVQNVQVAIGIEIPSRLAGDQGPLRKQLGPGKGRQHTQGKLALSHSVHA